MEPIIVHLSQHNLQGRSGIAAIRPSVPATAELQTPRMAKEVNEWTFAEAFLTEDRNSPVLQYQPIRRNWGGSGHEGVAGIKGTHAEVFVGPFECHLSSFPFRVSKPEDISHEPLLVSQ